MMKNAFYLLCGLPGSGKSTTARRLHDETGAVIISSDAIRLMLTGGSYPSNDHYEQLEPVVWQMVDALLRLALQAQQDVILDTTALTRDLRQRWVRIARQSRRFSELTIRILWHDGEYDTPERWQRERGIASEEHARIMAKLRARMERPTDEELAYYTMLNALNKDENYDES